MLEYYNYIINKHSEQLYIIKKRDGGTNNSPFANVGLEM